MTSEAPKLLPCPFCGGEATTWITDARSHDSADHVIGCPNCDIHKPFAGVCESYIPHAPDTTEWNTRDNSHALAMVAAAYEDAQAEVATEWNNPDAPDDGICEHIMQSIRARTPTDAQAALDAALKAERVKALWEAYEKISEMWASTTQEHMDAIRAMIKKENGHE